ncbi:MAG: choice-of-anchor Q domain-containing protein [Bacteroidota bacterium]|nr:choice-of-anchor Q domain-containing protein [Bacteroidota bacterium]
MRIIIISLIIGVGIAFFSACDMEQFTTDPKDKLSFSRDTVQFDTIFTSIGSTTKYFTVINPHDKALKIDKIALARGKQSVFRLNINGYQSTTLTDVEILPNDSIFVFVEVTIDPSTNDMVEKDSVVFQVNSNNQDVKLVAFGQNVHLFNGKTITNDTIWTNDKPFLIYNSLLVDENVTLQIQQGTQLHFHYGSSMLVNGSLKVYGTYDQPVVFQGDRLENYYDDIPGQWGAWLELDGGGIYLLGGLHFLQGSKNNELYYTEIKNSIIGVRADSVVTPSTPTLTMDNCIVQHMNVAGLYGAGAHIEATNSLFSDCGQYTAALLYGGNYDFRHCVFANYFSGTRQTSSVVLNNYFAYDNSSGQTIVDTRPFDAFFGNCIVYGNLEEELEIDGIEEGGFEYLFDHCLIKTQLATNNPHFNVVMLNQAPEFIDKYVNYDFRLDSLSPAIDAGDVDIANTVPIDYDGNSRLIDDGPDMGAFERMQ